MPLQAQPSTRVVLSGARSVTHLVYAASWLRHVVAGLEAAGGPEGAVEVVVLDVGSGFGRATVGEAEVREHLPQHPRLRVTTSPRDEHWRASKGLDRVLLSIGVPGTRAWARLFWEGADAAPSSSWSTRGSVRSATGEAVVRHTDGRVVRRCGPRCVPPS